MLSLKLCVQKQAAETPFTLLQDTLPSTRFWSCCLKVKKYIFSCSCFTIIQFLPVVAVLHWLCAPCWNLPPAGFLESLLVPHRRSNNTDFLQKEEVKLLHSPFTLEDPCPLLRLLHCHPGRRVCLHALSAGCFLSLVKRNMCNVWAGEQKYVVNQVQRS